MTDNAALKKVPKPKNVIARFLLLGSLMYLMISLVTKMPLPNGVMFVIVIALSRVFLFRSNRMRDYVLTFVIGMVVAITISMTIFRVWTVVESAMAPTIKSGDKVIVLPLLRKPNRGDIVLFETDDVQGGKHKIFRVVGMPGEQLSIKDSRVMINGEFLIGEPYDAFVYYNNGSLDNEKAQIAVPSGAYFVLGDNSAHANDSRLLGMVSENSIKGKAFLVRPILEIVVGEY